MILHQVSFKIKFSRILKEISIVAGTAALIVF